MSELQSYEFMAGRLIRRELRNVMGRLKFHGHNIEWIEQKGLLSSTFLVRGSVGAIASLRVSVRRHSATYEAQTA